MSNARSPRAVCSTTIGTNAMCGFTLKLISATWLLYVALPFAGRFFFCDAWGPCLKLVPFCRGIPFEGVTQDALLICSLTLAGRRFIRAWTFNIFSSNFSGSYYKVKGFAVSNLLPDTIQRVFLCQACPQSLFGLADAVSPLLDLA